VQLVWGEDDTFGPPAVGERAADLIPDADLHVVPGGHGPWFRHAQDVGERLAPFLRKHSGPGYATVRSRRWRFLATEPGRSEKWTWPSSSTATMRTTARP
jgi:hypothetical protein